MEQNLLFKVLVVGNPGAGKTCCIRKIVYNAFQIEYKATIGVDFAYKVIKLNHNGKDISVRIQLWDIAGQEKDQTLTRVYFRDSFGCLIVGDLEEQKLVQDIAKWKTDVDSKVQFPNSTEQIPCICLCNKVDREASRQNFDDKLKSQLQNLNFDGIFGTSAATGEGLNEALECLCKKILTKVDQYQPVIGQKTGVINSTNQDKPNKKCC